MASDCRNYLVPPLPTVLNQLWAHAEAIQLPQSSSQQPQLLYRKLEPPKRLILAPRTSTASLLPTTGLIGDVGSTPSIPPDIAHVTKPVFLHSASSTSVPADLARRRQRRPTVRNVDHMRQACRLVVGILFILGSFLAVSRLAQTDGTGLAEVRAQRLRSRHATEEVDMEKATELLLNNEEQLSPEESTDNLVSIYEQLDNISECNQTLDTPLLRLLLNSSANLLEKQEGDSKVLYLAQLFSKHIYLISQCKSF